MNPFPPQSVLEHGEAPLHVCFHPPTGFQEEIEDENRVDISICINQILRKYLKPDYMKNSSTIFLNLLPNDETSSVMIQQRILKLLNEVERLKSLE